MVRDRPCITPALSTIETFGAVALCFPCYFINLPNLGNWSSGYIHSAHSNAAKRLRIEPALITMISTTAPLVRYRLGPIAFPARPGVRAAYLIGQQFSRSGASMPPQGSGRGGTPRGVPHGDRGDGRDPIARRSPPGIGQAHSQITQP
jgi:hypothetical protein